MNNHEILWSLSRLTFLSPGGEAYWKEGKEEKKTNKPKKPQELLADVNILNAT